MMKKEFKNWREFLAEKRGKFHDRYEAIGYLGIEQAKDIDRTDIMDEIRRITGVTTVYREKEISTSPRTFVGEYIIRFVLAKGKDPTLFYNKDLKPALKLIPGLTIEREFDWEKIGDE